MIDLPRWEDAKARRARGLVLEELAASLRSPPPDDGVGRGAPSAVRGSTLVRWAEGSAVKVVEGDLIKLALAGAFDVIVHGANCQCTMGAGIAKAIKLEFPEAFEADLRTTKGDRAKLGTISSATVVRGGRSLTIVNAYTQFDYRGSKVRVDYDGIRAAMRAVRAQFGERRIGYPRVGAGLGGGDWDRISTIIEEELSGTDHTLVEFRP